MPGATPRYGIRYPLLGEPVNAARIAETMTDVDTLVTALNARIDRYLKRAAVSLQSFATVSVLPAVLSALPFDIVVANPDGIYNAGAPTNLTAQESGVYLIAVQRATIFTAGATVTGIRWEITLNGVPFCRRSKQHASGSNTLQTSMLALLPMFAGDVAQLRFLYSASAGGPITSVFVNGLVMVKVGSL